MTTWPEVTLGEICSKPEYGAIAKGTDRPVGPLYVRQTDLVGGTIDWSTVPYCDLDEKQVPRYELAADDLLIARLGSVGRASRVRDPRGAVFAGYLVRFRAKAGVVDPRFLGYELLSPSWWEHVEAVRSGAVQPTLNAKQMSSFRFRLPPLDQQREIAATLGALDDKAESNRRVIEKTLVLAHAVYDEAVADASREACVGDVAEFHNRRRIPLSRQEREARPGDIPYYGATGIFGYVDDFLFDEILVLVGEDGSVVRDNGGPVIQYIWGKAWINNHAHPLTGRGVSNELLYIALDRSDIRPLVTGAVQAKISMGNLRSLVLHLPPEDAQAELEDRLAALFAVWRARADETRHLEGMRDMLLSALLSGRVRVSRAAETAA